MFQVGDKIKCVDNSNYDFQLDTNESYIFVEYFENENYLIIKGKEDIAYISERFELDIVYYRKQKIQKLKERISGI